MANGRDTPPFKTEEAVFHVTWNTPDARLVDVEVDGSGSLLSREYATASGLLYGGSGVRTASTLIQVRMDERGKKMTEWWDLLDVYHVGSDSLEDTVDVGCNIITAITETTWGFAAMCVVSTEGILDNDSVSQDKQISVIGIIDGKVAWRLPLSEHAWWAALGTDGDTLLAIENVWDQHPKDDDGTAHPVRAVRIDNEGRVLGDEVRSEGRVIDKLLWTGREYAAIDDASITRYDSYGNAIGTWRFEPDCTREIEDVQLTWTGEAYAACGWWRTVSDKSDPLQAGFCREVEVVSPCIPMPSTTQRKRNAGQ